MYVGLDVSSRSIHVALIRPDSEVIAEERILNTTEAIAKLVRSWGDPPRVRACYEEAPPDTSCTASSPRSASTAPSSLRRSSPRAPVIM
jgi:hypothetical protein